MISCSVCFLCLTCFLVGIKWYLVVGLIHLSLMLGVFLRLSGHLYGNVHSGPLPIFSWAACLSVLELQEFFIYPGYQTLIWYMVYISPILGLSLHSLDSIRSCTFKVEAFNFNEIQYIYFFFCCLCFCYHLLTFHCGKYWKETCSENSWWEVLI